MKKTFLLTCLCLSCLVACNNQSLFNEGKTGYRILVAQDASTSEKTAANELKDYLHQISGAEFETVDDQNAKKPLIVIGNSERTRKDLGTQDIPADDEAFTIRRKGGNIYIYGGSRRGTMYGVFDFLERELGVRWYTRDCTVVPKKDEWSLQTKEYHSEPALKYRYTDFYPQWTDDYKAHNKMNMGTYGAYDNEYGGLSGYWLVHTMPGFVSAAEYYKDHPEYFGLRNGKRDPKAQLCLSNPEVLEICKERMLHAMEANPYFTFYSLSQGDTASDNVNTCECPRCVAIEQKYGAHSGLLLWFVNQVADFVKEKYPDKYVGTLAYQFNRKPPVGIVPRDNVVIRLCSIECCFAHPLDAGCTEGAAFMEDFEGWQKIAPHLFIWDYVVNFCQFIAPFPNYGVLAQNLRIFKENNAIGVFEEGPGTCQGIEFEELKTWVLSKLMWNPYQEVEPIVDDFIYGYYGAAAPKIKEYWSLCQSLVKPDTHFHIYLRASDPFFKEFFTDEFVTKASKILDEAKQLADNQDLIDKVDKVRLQILYLKSELYHKASAADGTWDEFCALARKFHCAQAEGRNIEDYIKMASKWMVK